MITAAARQLGPLVPLLLALAGLLLVVSAAFTLGLGPGLLVAGAACWVAEWRVTNDDGRSARP